jgi:resuscitation-promoting factor RpfB
MNNIKSWFTGMSRVGQVSLIAVVAIIFLGGIATVSAMTSPPNKDKSTSTQVEKKPVITTKEEVKTEAIPFEKESVESDSLPKGQTQIQTIGVDGIKTITYTITLIDGKETNRTSLEAVTTKPVNEVKVIGTYVEPEPDPNCDSNYSGCVPIASDVDCAGGSGNGPAYVAGPVQVIGYDIYDLDRDGDGWGCE